MTVNHECNTPHSAANGRHYRLTPPTAQPLEVSDMGGGGGSKFLHIEHVGEGVESSHKRVKVFGGHIHSFNIVCCDETFVIQRWHYHMLGCLLCSGCIHASRVWFVASSLMSMSLRRPKQVRFCTGMSAKLV